MRYCARAREHALHTLWERDEVERHVQRCVEHQARQAESRQAVLRSRAAVAPHDSQASELVALHEEKVISDALSMVFAEPTARVESCGVVLLSSEDPFGAIVAP